MITFNKMTVDDQEMVMQWRALPSVTQYMVTDIEPDLDKQIAWFHKISNDPSCLYLIVQYNKIPIGVINLASIDTVNRRCTAGYYIGNLEYRSVGAIVPAYIYNYVFNDLKLNKIYGEVLEENTGVMHLHKLFGYETVGVMRQHVFKNNQFHNVVIMELRADEWAKQKKYQSYIPEIEL